MDFHKKLLKSREFSITFCNFAVQINQYPVIFIELFTFSTGLSTGSVVPLLIYCSRNKINLKVLTEICMYKFYVRKDYKTVLLNTMNIQLNSKKLQENKRSPAMIHIDSPRMDFVAYAFKDISAIFPA